MIDRSSSEGVTTLTLARPPLNILNEELVSRLDATLEALLPDPETRMVVLTSGIPGTFSAGADVREHLPPDHRSMIPKFVALCDRLVRSPKPTMAVVDGRCLGGGMELALSCDFVVCTDRSTFGQPEISVGVFPPIGAALYPRLLGLRSTYRVLLDPRPIEAAEALRIGAVNRVVPPSELASIVKSLTTAIAGSSGAVIALAKRAIREGLPLSWDLARDRATQVYLDELMGTEDAIEGLQAFLAKRRPHWKDR